MTLADRAFEAAMDAAGTPAFPAALDRALLAIALETLPPLTPEERAGLTKLARRLRYAE